MNFFLSKERKLSSSWGEFELAKFKWIIGSGGFKSTLPPTSLPLQVRIYSQSKIWSMKLNNHPASRGSSIFLDNSGRGKSRRLAEVPSSSRLIYEDWRASARRVQNGPLPTQKDGGFSSIHVFYSSWTH